MQNKRLNNNFNEKYISRNAISVAFAVMFLISFIKFLQDVQFSVYNLFLLSLNPMYCVLGIILIGLAVYLTYRLFKKTVASNSRSAFFIIGVISLLVYQFFVHSWLYEFLSNRDQDYFFQMLQSSEVRTTHYFVPITLLLVCTWGLFMVLKDNWDLEEDVDLIDQIEN